MAEGSLGPFRTDSGQIFDPRDPMCVQEQLEILSSFRKESNGHFNNREHEGTMSDNRPGGRREQEAVAGCNEHKQGGQVPRGFSMSWPKGGDEESACLTAKHNQTDKIRSAGGVEKQEGKILSSDGSYIKTYPGGESLNILSKRHTWEAIAKGRATLVRCIGPGCRTRLQIDRNADLVRCSKCGLVFPKNLPINDSPRQAGSKRIQEEDGQIAKSVQEQEYSATLFKKRSSSM